MTNAIRLVFKDHDCTYFGALSAWDSFVCQSLVNDVGRAQLVAHWGVSTEDDAILNELDTADVIIEVYVRPEGHRAFLEEPAWEGFLRDTKVEQDGSTQKLTTTFYDYNHLLARRVIKPPDKESHDEEYGRVGNIMRELVRKHAAENAGVERQILGLSVEANEEDYSGLYDAHSSLVFGSNLPEWVRANCLYEWDGHLYVGLEEAVSTGQGASIYRTADGIAWERVYDAGPGIYSGIYPEEVHGIYCFKEFDGWLYAGAGSSNGRSGDGVLLRSFDGENWQVAHIFTDARGVWALEEFDGYLYAGLTAFTNTIVLQTLPWLVRSDDGFTWTNIQTVTGRYEIGTWATVANTFNVRCMSIKERDNKLYIGVSWRNMVFLVSVNPIRETYQGRIYESSDGITFIQRLGVSNAFEGVLTFEEFGDYLYAGTGRDRYTQVMLHDSLYNDVCYTVSAGRIYRTEDGATWTQVFGGSECHAITSFLVTTNDDDWEAELWAAGGSPEAGNAKIWRSKDGESWAECYNLAAPPYHFALALSDFTITGYHYAATGSYNRSKSCYGNHTYTADYGDVWSVVPLASNVEQSGMAGRWTYLLEKLKEIAEQSGSHDFRVVGKDTFLYCLDDVQNFEFQVRSPQWGDDNRWDGTQGMTFSLARGNMGNPELETIRGNRPTHLYVLGPSAEDDRIIEEYPNAEAQEESPWGRIEAVVDAQGVESSHARSSMGWAELEIQGPKKTLNFDVIES